MTDEKEDRLDGLLREAAKDYNVPPATPRQEVWERIQAARRADRRSDGQGDAVMPFRPSDRRTTRPAIRLLVGLAALLALGIAIGRFSAPGTRAAVPAGSPTSGPASTDRGTGLSGSGTVARPNGARGKGEVATQFVTAQHLGRVESFLTEFDTRNAAQDFSRQAQDLLSTTRLLLDSKRLTDVRTRQLLEDLELVLIQIATLNAKDRREDLDFIADGLAQGHLRTRLRSALPAGPAIRM